MVGLLSSYSHLSKINVSVNQFIEQGEKLGKLVLLEELQTSFHWSVYLIILELIQINYKKEFLNYSLVHLIYY